MLSHFNRYSNRKLLAAGVLAIAFALAFLHRRRSSRTDLFHQASMPGDRVHDSGERKWWKEAVFYEIYPASFKDSNDDGVGDIRGMISKLDYLQDLGIDVIAIGPHYQSPHVDMGYDVSDYQDIHRPYGTIEDVLALIEATHSRGMRIIFDLVINHSSNLHEFFKQSRSSKDNPKRDWYFWRPAKIDAEGNRHPPNNWRSHFSVPAWTWDEATQEYYLHVYAPEMPDFNWENEDFRKAIYETAIISWLERGIDGFRIDTVNKYSKDISFPDAEVVQPGEETQPASQYYSNGPRIHEFLGEMQTVFERYDAVSVGELSSFEKKEENVLPFISASTGQLNMVFNFDIDSLGVEKEKRKGKNAFTVPDFKREMSKWQLFAASTDAWITLYLENHDTVRSVSRFGSDSSVVSRIRSGKMLAVIVGTMSGTLFMYQGQELGMANAPREWPEEEYKDIKSVNMFKKAREASKGNPEGLKKAIDRIWKGARDHARLPMQWDDGPNAGFTSEGVTPWMRVHDDWREVNAKRQNNDPDSLLQFWKKVLQLRKEYKNLFVYGKYELLETEDEDLFIFTKTAEGIKAITIINMSNRDIKWDGLPAEFAQQSQLLLGNVEENDGVLKPWEAMVYLKRAA